MVLEAELACILACILTFHLVRDYVKSRSTWKSVFNKSKNASRKPLTTPANRSTNGTRDEANRASETGRYLHVSSVYARVLAVRTTSCCIPLQETLGRHDG
jgi:hypothetical protein